MLLKDPHTHKLTLTCSSLFLALMLCVSMAWAGPKGKGKGKQKHLTVQRITQPPMVSPPAVIPLLTKGRVHVRVKLVYAHNRSRKYTDHRLRRDLPNLSNITGFNAYKLMRRIEQKVPFNRSILIRISSRFQVRLNPKGYIIKGRNIALQATFLYRVRKGKKRGTFAAYATTHLRLKNRRQVVFVGPAHRKGRALLILSATKK